MSCVEVKIRANTGNAVKENAVPINNRKDVNSTNYDQNLI